MSCDYFCLYVVSSQLFCIEWDILARRSWTLNCASDNKEEASRVAARQEKAGKNPSVKRDPLALYNMHMPDMTTSGGFLGKCYNDGRILTEADRHEHLLLARDRWTPFLKQARDQFRGAKREFVRDQTQ